MTEKNEFNERLKKVDDLRKQGIKPFAYNYNRKDEIKDIIYKYSKIKPDEKKPKAKVNIAGRIRSIRGHGKAVFADIEDFSGKIQFYVGFKEVGKKQFEIFKKFINIGDIIGLKGFIFKTRKGELSIWSKKFELLTKSLRGLPHEWFGLKEVETRYRQRYLDLIMNPDVREIFTKRSAIIYAMREFMREKGYVEVETPILQPLYGGALARPFVTHHHTLKRKMYLRISNEMYLKRLIAGGFEKVFEFSPDFRNEGIDTMHNPEFLLFEAMTAYSDYKDGMKLFEEIVEYAAKKVLGTTKLTYQGQKIDLKTPWKKLTVANAVKKYLKLNVKKLSVDELVKYAKKNNVKLLKKKPTKGELAAALFEEFVEPKLIQPTIIYNYPVEISPLAKKCRNNPDFTERFEVFICGSEYGNNYTEITDPVELRNNFKYQLKRGKAGDEEAHPMDEDFLRAMEYGMPPTCGLGIGMDRLFMLFTDSNSIRDVIFFPQLREKEKEKTEEIFGDQIKDTVIEKVSKKKGKK